MIKELQPLQERLRTVEEHLRAIGQPRLAEDVFLASARISLLEREMVRYRRAWDGLQSIHWHLTHNTANPNIILDIANVALGNGGGK